MTERATPAPPIFPFPDHRTLAQIEMPVECKTCGDEVQPGPAFECAYDKCPINREPLW